MLTIPTSVKKSDIQGIGLFTDQDVSKGDIIWKFNPIIDVVYDPKDVEKMNEAERKIILHHAFLSKISGMYVLPGDNDRFMNHSLNNNVDSVFFDGEKELLGVANRDIQAGEELLANYTHFDAHDAVSDEEYLQKV